MGRRLRALLAVVAALAALAGDARADDVPPPDFVRLREVAPTILQDIRYAGTFNFTGARVPGYEAPECILWRPAAEALRRAESRLARDRLHLKVYDCYRPVRAVRAFAAWAKAPGSDEMKSIFYPALDKSRLFALGYIASNSRHSRGTAVDVGLATEADAALAPPSRAGPCDGPLERRARESSLDLGTAFDCFSEASGSRDAGIAAPARANRARLRLLLMREGFRPYAREWWHFELVDPHPPEPQDFPVR